MLTLKLKTPGTPYWKRPDLGISREDVFIQGNTVGVKVHNIGAVDAPAATLESDGQKAVKSSPPRPIPPPPVPLDLYPKTANVTLTMPAGMQIEGASVVIDPGKNVEEITQRNNRVQLTGP